MPSYSKLFLKPFIGGLNTEGSDTDDLTLNTSDELNCTILPEGKRGRRYGFNIEQGGRWIEVDEPIRSHAVYHWSNAREDDNFIVVQINTKIFIFEENDPYSGSDPIFTLNLTDKYTTGDSLDPLSFTSINETLFIASRWIYPLVITYSKDTDTFNVSINNLKFRDIVGVDDGFDVDYMPTQTDMNQNHLYNLYNQGWDSVIYNPENRTTTHLLPISDPSSGKFYQDIQKFPANNLQWFIGKEKSGEYKTTDLLNTYFGNTPAPKGHFILDYINRNRSYSSGIYVSKDVSIPSGKSYTGSHNLLFRTGLDAERWFILVNGNAQTLEEFGFSKDYVPSNYYSFSPPAEFTGVIKDVLFSIKDVNNIGKVNSGHITLTTNELLYEYLTSRNMQYLFKDTIAVEIYGIKGDGKETLIDTKELYRYPRVTKSDVWTQYYLHIDNDVSYSRYRFQLIFPNAAPKVLIPFSIEFSVAATTPPSGESSDIEEGLPSTNILSGAVTHLTAFGGRIFYLCKNTLLFSQTLKADNKGYDLCYQDADPTSEEISDVVATDGGMIQLLTIGKGKNIHSFYRGVIVFGDREVTGVLSNSINLFSATDYDIVKITNAGCCGEYSIVETDNEMFYWSTHGIYRISIDENNNISAQCVSVGTIQQWYNSLSISSKENVIGYYDYANNRIYWFYPTNEVSKLDGCLVYDLTYNCFMPQQIDAGNIVRDDKGEYVGKIENFNIIYKNGKKELVTVDNNIVKSNITGETVGYTQSKYITDCTRSATVKDIYPSIRVRAGGIPVKAGDDNVIATNQELTKFQRKTSGIILVSDTDKYSFGDFNDREFRDWDVSPYESYMVSKPISLGDTFYDKQTPVMQTLFQRTETYKLNDYNPTSLTAELTYDLTPWFTYTYFKSQSSYYTYMFVNVAPLVGNPSKFVNGSVAVDASFLKNDFIVSPYTVKAELRGFMDGGTYYNPERYDVVANAEQTLSEYKRTSLVLQSTVHASKKYDRYELYTIIDWFSYHIPANVITTFPKQWNPESAVARVVMTDVDTSNGIFDSTKKEYATKDIYVFDRAGIYNSDGVKGAKANVVKGYVAGYNVNCTPVWYYTPHPTEWNATVSARMPRPDDKYKVKTQLVSNDSNRFSYPGITLGNPTILHAEKSLMYTDKICFDDESNLPQMNFTGTVTTIVPVLQQPTKIELNTAEYITASGANIRMRWGWSLNDKSNRWDMIQNGYRPQKDFLYDEYVESRLHICGRGKAFQIEIRNDSNKDFRVLGLNIITRSK